MAYVKNTWIDRVGVTRYFESIDDDGAKILNPDYSQLTEIGTPVNADNMNHIEDGIGEHEERITNLENNNAAANFLNKTQITNCITEIPQRIKLELNNGVLTLKAGSVVIVPNGFEADGTTPKFDYVTVESDCPWVSSTSTGTRLGFYVGDNAMAGCVSNYMYSGDTAKMNSTSAVTYGRFYNTQTNKIYVGNSNGGSWVETQNSLPICIFKNDATGTVTSLDQTFNGFGYIGSTVWVDKGVKGLIPNGRNEDGSLKNIECTTSKVLTFQTTANLAVVFDSNQIGTGYYYLTEKANLPYSWYYDEKQNLVYRQQEAGTGFDTDNFMTKSVYIGNVYADSTGITSFNPKQAFRAVDYNEFKEATKQPKGFTTSYNVSTGWVAPTNGLLYVEGYSDSKGNTAYITVDNLQFHYNYQSGSNANHHTIGVIVPIYKGQTISGMNLNRATFYQYSY